LTKSLQIWSQFFGIMPFDIEITFDWSWIHSLGTKPFYELFWFFLINGGWVVFALVCVWGFLLIYKFRQQVKFGAKQKYVFLAIDIPRQNLQTPKAVENIFSTIAGAHTPLEWEEKFFNGAYQIGFSFEIVSIDGFVQFIVRTASQFRDMVESAFYAQYPDAEITEVEDYLKDIDVTFPNDEYKIWGADLKLYNKDFFPIRSYKEFESPMTKDIKDPLTSLLEVMNKLKTGEQFWLQYLVWPTDISWTKRGINELKKMSGKSVEEKRTWVDKTLDAPLNLLGEISSQLLGTGEAEEKKDEKLTLLPPDDQKRAEAIFRKISNMGFECKVRMVYFGRKEVFNKGLGVSGTFGAIKQYSDLSLNGFKPDKNKTVARWPFFKNLRLHEKENNIFRAYKARTSEAGCDKFILTSEELASLYHFPYFETQGPIVKRVESKKALAPIGLPVEDESQNGKIKARGVKAIKTKKVPVVEYEDDYFEKRFAKDKTGKNDKKRKEKILEELKEQKEKKLQIEKRIKHSNNFNQGINDDNIINVSKEETLTAVQKPEPPKNLPFA